MKTVDMNQVRSEMQEHWGMSPEEFDAHQVGETHWFKGDFEWCEMVFTRDGEPKFFIEVKDPGSVWNFEAI